MKKRYTLQVIDNKTLETISSKQFDEEDRFLKLQFKIVIIAIFILTAVSISLGIHINGQNKLKAEKERSEQLIAELQDCNMYSHLNIMIGEALRCEDSDFENLDEVYKYIQQSEVWYPEIVMAQFILESGSGTSNVCQNANNYFGMKPAKVRERVNLEGKDYNGYASYKNWKLSVLDRRLWELQWFDGEQPKIEKYKKSLTKYAEDPQYINKLEKIIKEHEVFNK